MRASLVLENDVVADEIVDVTSGSPVLVARLDEQDIAIDAHERQDGAYALFQPERGTGVVILANRFWSNSARIETAYSILKKLDPGFFDD